MTHEPNPKSWRLFLDDERYPTWDLGQVEIAKDCAEAIALVQELGVPELISFDHDLGKEDTGAIKPTAMFFLRWLIDEDLGGRPDFDLRDVKRVIVHSANYAGASNIIGLWDGYAVDIKSEVRAERRPRQSLIK
jgi:hypothetical protein